MPWSKFWQFLEDSKIQQPDVGRIGSRFRRSKWTNHEVGRNWRWDVDSKRRVAKEKDTPLFSNWWLHKTPKLGWVDKQPMLFWMPQTAVQDPYKARCHCSRQDHQDETLPQAHHSCRVNRECSEQMLSVIKNIRDHLMDEGLDCVRFLSGISKPRVLVLLSVRNKSMNCSLMTSALIFINSCISQLCLVSNDRYRLCHSCVESSQHLQSINAVNSRCNLNTISIRMHAPVHWGTSCHGWKSAPQQPTHANKSITIKEEINISYLKINLHQ